MLEGLAIAPFVSALIALAGVLVGLGIARFVLPGTRKIKRLEAEIEQLRRELSDYRGRVNTHFHKTAELIGNMTASYKAVYDHLSDGAQTLCAGDALSGPAPFSAPRLILADNVDVTLAGVRPATPTPESVPQAGAADPAAAAAASRAPASSGAGEGSYNAAGTSAGMAVSDAADVSHASATGSAAPTASVTDADTQAATASSRVTT